MLYVVTIIQFCNLQVQKKNDNVIERSDALFKTINILLNTSAPQALALTHEQKKEDIQDDKLEFWQRFAKETVNEPNFKCTFKSTELQIFAGGI